MGATLKDELQSMPRRWKDLAVGATWICGIIGSFFVGPPVGTYDQFEGSLTKFGVFVVTILVGVFVIIGRKYQDQEHARLWATITAFFLIMGAASYFTYWKLSNDFTAEYNDSRVVIGPNEGFTEYAKEHMRRNPGITREELIMDFAGQLSEIWTQESIDRRRIFLAITYILCLPFFTVTIMAMVQALRCIFPGDNNAETEDVTPPASPSAHQVNTNAT